MLRATRPLSLALVFAFLFATVLDFGHQHDSPAAELQCYTCHFSPDAGPAIDSDAAVALSVRAVRSAPDLPALVLAAESAPYTARGPPLTA